MHACMCRARKRISPLPEPPSTCIPAHVKTPNTVMHAGADRARTRVCDVCSTHDTHGAHPSCDRHDLLPSRHRVRMISHRSEVAQWHAAVVDRPLECQACLDAGPSRDPGPPGRRRPARQAPGRSLQSGGRGGNSALLAGHGVRRGDSHVDITSSCARSIGRDVGSGVECWACVGCESSVDGGHCDRRPVTASACVVDDHAWCGSHCSCGCAC